MRDYYLAVVAVSIAKAVERYLYDERTNIE